MWSPLCDEQSANSLAGILFVRSNTAIRTSFGVRGKPQHLNARFEDNLRRIAQQALDNALQHPQATEIRVGLVFSEKSVRLHVTDNGRGFVMSKLYNRGMGINGMRERAKEIGGTCAVKSQRGRGPHVTVKVPVPSAEHSCEGPP